MVIEPLEMKNIKELEKIVERSQCQFLVAVALQPVGCIYSCFELRVVFGEDIVLTQHGRHNF